MEAIINKRCCVQCDNGGAGSLDPGRELADAADRYRDAEEHLGYNPASDRYETGGDEIEYADES